MSIIRTIDPVHARRLFISKQHLDAAPPPAMLDLIRAIGCLQLDPIRKVERPPQMILWSRLGDYDPDDLEQLRWDDRALFEYWAHAASLVLTEDYPIYATAMQRHQQPGGKVMQWVEEQGLHGLRQHILTRIRDHGPLGTSDFDDQTTTDETFSGWTNGRAVNRLMDRMWTMGDVLVAARQGNQRKWDLAGRFLPDWTPREELSPFEASYRATQRAIQALGVAKGRKDINYTFTRGRYWHINKVLATLIADEKIIPVQVGDWSGDWYMHTDDLALLARIERGEWEGKTTLLSPFDNLICGRSRTELFWDFYFRIEIYVPKDKREFGYYVLPILHHDDLIGRMDMEMDRKTNTLHVLATYAEDGAPPDATRAIGDNLHSLAHFLGATDLQFGETLPAQWASLRN